MLDGKRYRGFTLVELVVVVVVVGIVAATAYTRMADVRSDSHKAFVAMTASSLANAIQLAQSVCVTRNGAATLNLSGYHNNTVDFNAKCFPVGTGATLAQVSGNGNVNATRCLQVWNAVLNPAPANATTATADFQTSSPNTTTCRFTYRKDAGVTRRFDYSLASGAVIVTNP